MYNLPIRRKRQMCLRGSTGAVHEDQVKVVAEALRKSGETVDISRHFGFVSRWTLTGPFDNREEKGFAVAYAPEKEFETQGPNLAAEYDGMNGKVTWKPSELSLTLIDRCRSRKAGRRGTPACSSNIKKY